MTEKLALQKRFRDGRTIDLDQRTGSAGTPRMDHVGQNFLAHAAFAGDQNTAFRRGDE